MGGGWNWLKILIKGAEPSGFPTKELVVKLPNEFINLLKRVTVDKTGRDTWHLIYI
jgi:hypothetical protein